MARNRNNDIKKSNLHIYLVVRFQGMYDEREKVIVRAYMSKELALLHADKANKRTEELLNAKIYDCQEYGVVYDDTLWTIDDTIRYKVEAVELLEKLPDDSSHKQIPLCEICNTRVVAGTLYKDAWVEETAQWKAVCEDCGDKAIDTQQEIIKLWDNIPSLEYTDSFICFSKEGYGVFLNHIKEMEKR